MRQELLVFEDFYLKRMGRKVSNPGKKLTIKAHFFSFQFQRRLFSPPLTVFVTLLRSLGSGAIHPVEFRGLFLKVNDPRPTPPPNALDSDVGTPGGALRK